MGSLCPHRSPPVGGWYYEGKNEYKLDARVEITSDCSISASGEMPTADEIIVYFSQQSEGDHGPHTAEWGHRLVEWQDLDQMELKTSFWL